MDSRRAMPPSRLLSAALLLFVAAYLGFVGWYHAPYAAASDASGYMNSARLILDGRLGTPLRPPAGLPPDLVPRQAFVPLGFRPDVRNEGMVPTYPVGLPLHLAAVGLFTDLSVASRTVAVGSALAFVVLLYLTGREFGVRPAWSLGVALLGALSPLTLFFAFLPMSDLLAAVWGLAVILCARRAARGPGWAVAAGAALAVAVLVRPTNLLLVVPALLALPAHARSWVAFGLGGVPGALFLAWYNHAQYGAWLTTGYIGAGSLFSWQHVAPSLWHYAVWVPVAASPLVVAALALPRTTVPRRDQLILAAWAGVVLGFYAGYSYTNDAWWYLRFVLSALPALGLAAALVLQDLPFPTWLLASRLLPAGAPASPVATGWTLRLPLVRLLLLGAVGWLLHWSGKLHVTHLESDERSYPLAARWVAEALPDDGVLLAYQVSGALLHYTDKPFVVYEHLPPDDGARLAAWVDRERRTLYAALYPHEEAAVWQKFPGRWEQVAQFRLARIWRRVDRDPPTP